MQLMSIGGVAHMLMVFASIVISIVLFFVVKKSKEKVQNAIIYTLVGICAFGIFFLHCTKYFTDFDLGDFLIQMLQVCNFNFILLPFCLFKKNELARQYLFLFSMPMALSTFVSYPSDVEGSMWYSVVCLTFWINHFLIALIPILMVATKRFKPRREYLLKVMLCIFIYFSIAFIGNYVLNDFSINGAHNHSYTMGADSIALLIPLYDAIPIPFVYLLPMGGLLLFVYWIVVKLFNNYSVNGSFGIKFICKKED